MVSVRKEREFTSNNKIVQDDTTQLIKSGPGEQESQSDEITSDKN